MGRYETSYRADIGREEGRNIGRDVIYFSILLKIVHSAVNFAFVQLEARSIRLEKRYERFTEGQRWKLRNVAN